MANLTQAEILRYSRHLVLPEVGLEGQQKLKDARVLIVGTGGLGSPISLYLAAAGVGCIGLVDYDTVDETNLQRQIVHGTSRVGMPKVESAKQRILDLNPYVHVETYQTVLRSDNALSIAENYDILVDGTDNFPTRYLLNDLAVFTKKPYVYGSIFRFEGQVCVFDARVGPCYRCLFPEPPPPGMVPSCAEGGVFGVLPGIVGTLQATEVLKLILGTGEPLIGKLLLVDALDSTFQTVQLRKNPVCKLCGEAPQIQTLIDYEEFCGVPVAGRHLEQDIPELSPRDVVERLSSGESFAFLDVRDPVELQVSRIPGAVVIPVGQLPARVQELDREKKWVVFCRTGERSYRAVKLLQSAGFQAYNLKGGINAWADQVDPEMLKY